jgi:hypothetical protein
MELAPANPEPSQRRFLPAFPIATRGKITVSDGVKASKRSRLESPHGASVKLEEEKEGEEVGNLNVEEEDTDEEEDARDSTMRWTSPAHYPAGKPDEYLGGFRLNLAKAAFPSMVKKAVKDQSGKILIKGESAPKVAQGRLGIRGKVFALLLMWVKSALIHENILSVQHPTVTSPDRNDNNQAWIAIVQAFGTHEYVPAKVRLALGSTEWTQIKRYYWDAVDTIVRDQVRSIEWTITDAHKDAMGAGKKRKRTTSRT